MAHDLLRAWHSIRIAREQVLVCAGAGESSAQHTYANLLTTLANTTGEYVQTLAIITGWEMYERWDHVAPVFNGIRRLIQRLEEQCNASRIGEIAKLLPAINGQVKALSTMREDAQERFAYHMLGMPRWQEKIDEVKARYGVG
jgi:hypothetical protein